MYTSKMFYALLDQEKNPRLNRAWHLLTCVLSRPRIEGKHLDVGVKPGEETMTRHEGVKEFQPRFTLKWHQLVRVSNNKWEHLHRCKHTP